MSGIDFRHLRASVTIASKKSVYQAALDLCARVNKEAPRLTIATPLQLADWLLSSGLHVRFQMQLHKIVWDPNARGV